MNDPVRYETYQLLSLVDFENKYSNLSFLKFMYHLIFFKTT